MGVRRAVLFGLIVVAAACGRVANAPANPPEAFGGDPRATTDGAAGDALVIAFLGDSLTSGLGLLADQAYPNLIKEMFHAEGYPEVEVVNGGSSGDTTAGGLRRVDQFLGADTSILVVALGGNDALRGLTAAQTHDNLAAIINKALERRVVLFLAGMHAPTNLGEDYQLAFHNVFLRLATEFRGSISFVPFLLEGVAGDPTLNQADGIHPNVQGARIIAEHLFPELRRLVDNVLNVAR